VRRSNPVLHHVQLFPGGTDFSLCPPAPARTAAHPRFAPDNFSPGGIIAQGRGGSSPHLGEKYPCSPPSRHPSSTGTLACAHPSSTANRSRALFFFRWEPSVRVDCIELLPLAKQAGFETASSPIRIGALSWVEVTRTFTTPESLCGGNRRPGLYCLSDALSLSYSNFRRWQESNLRPSEPDVTQAFTTPQSLRSFFLLASLRLFFSFAHTCSVCMRISLHFAASAFLKLPGGISAHGFTGFKPAGLSAIRVKKYP
jgi:hypothetical protein